MRSTGDEATGAITFAHFAAWLTHLGWRGALWLHRLWNEMRDVNNNERGWEDYLLGEFGTVLERDEPISKAEDSVLRRAIRLRREGLAARRERLGWQRRFLEILPMRILFG